jgi:hypothetical protein
VEQTLLRLIERKEVRVYPPRHPFTPIIGKIDLGEELRLYIAGSSNALPLFRDEYCVVDALDLIDWVPSQIETRGRPPKHNWLNFERWCRDEIEATGNPKSGASLADKAMIACSKDLPKNTIPNKTKAEEITSKLIREYADPKMI